LTIHRRREWKLREAKIAEALKLFDFERTYGTLGRGYAQVHHLRRLADRGEDTTTALADLAVVCANCHVMIHRGGKNRQINRLVNPKPRI
jgi:5-methylcytosine-specific restriction protein A